MSGKTIAIWVVVIIIVLVGGWFIYSNVSSNSSSQNAAQNATSTASTASSTPQVQAQDVSVGTGTEAVPGDVVSVLYIGKLPDGTVFDSSASHGNKPLSFTLGQQGLIAGFQIGVNGMKVGGERVMSIPPELGYGAQAVTDASGTVIIPANSTLLFDVKLVGVKAGTSTSSTK
ncbi:MAG: FKBP-type peptidyl-prolyl cis-trans isomerase [Candidatus Pacebacteria bacterium]|nr:FKBP-type peptidyl-prolyl cis-trans isomerase [Candidatus Paceibacterota bacterium]